MKSISLLINTCLFIGNIPIAPGTMGSIFALIIVYGMRTNTKLVTPFARIASLGYSIPGAVAAIGILIPLVWLDSIINKISINLFNFSTGLILGKPS